MFILYRVTKTRKNQLKVESLPYLKVDLEVHRRREIKNDIIVKDLVLMEEMMIAILDIFMTKEKVLDTLRQIQDLEVIGEILSALRLLMIGSGMMNLGIVGSHPERPHYEPGHLTERRAIMGPIPLW